MKFIGICDSQALTGEGVRAVLATRQDVRCIWTCQNLFLVRQLLRQQPVDALVLDKGFGFQSILHLVSILRDAGSATAVVVWGANLTESEALRLLREGVRGVVRKNCNLDTFLRCLEAVLDGRTWVEDLGFAPPQPSTQAVVHSNLTPREQQVLELVEQGLRNKEIAAELGIKPGTVKIHMKHIFEKTGVHGRYGLAIQGLRQRAIEGFAEMPRVLAERAG